MAAVLRCGDEVNAPNSTAITIEHVDVESLHPDPANPRVISAADMEALTRNIATFGLVDPILARRADRVIIAGHQRLVAARKLGLKVVPAVFIDVTIAQARLLNLALNQIHGSFESELLARMLADLSTVADLDLTLTGFGEDELAKLLKTLDAREKRERIEDFDVDTALAKARTTTRVHPGERWRCADHVLLCGDSTNPEDVARLMDGERAALMATDPPYLVDYSGAASTTKTRRKNDEHWDDFEDADKAVAFYSAYLRAALPHLVSDAAIYQWHAHRRQALVERAWRECGLLVHEQLIWVKPRGVPTRSHFMWQHEPCFYGWVEGHAPKQKPPRTETTVWQIDHQAEQLGVHETQKPLELFMRPITYHTEVKDVCYEPFAGSGTQLIACEKLGRRSFAIERDAHYCAVALARIESFTGKEAQCLA
jgi:DNA modification methylase